VYEIDECVIFVCFYNGSFSTSHTATQMHGLGLGLGLDTRGLRHGL